MRAFCLLLTLLAAPAMADCPNESEVFACEINGKPLQICHWKGALIYNFGPRAKPELSIAEPLETVAFTPWPGVGRYMWETVDFRNGRFTYRVYTSVERGPEATTGLTGAVTVFEWETEIAYLECDAGTPTTSLDVLYGLKQSIGQCWDFDSKSWSTSCE